MIYFTSDLHFYHENIIKHANRPFNNADEMNSVLIKNWNKTVSDQDSIYILGDFTMKGCDYAERILNILHGRKHLIKGNHDRFSDQSNFDKSLFVEITSYKEIVINNTRFMLFHYPILEWNHYFRNAIHLHGHQHNHREYNIENRKNKLLRYDVGVDANDYKPISVDKIIEFFSK